MALDPKKLTEVNKLLKDIDSIYKKISDKNPFEKFNPSQIKDIDVEIEKLQKGLDEANIKLENWEDSISGIYDSFKSIVSEISKSNTGLSLSKQALTSASKVASELRDHHLGISTLSVKEIQNQKEKLLSSQQNLKSAQLILQEEKEKITNGRKYNQLSFKEKKTYNEIFQQLKSINRVIEDKDGLYKDTLDKLDETEGKEKAINKQLGVAGGLLKGISKIPILADVFDAKEAVGEMDKHLRAGGSSAGALGVGIKNISKQLKDGVLNSSNMIVAAFTFMVSTLKDMDKGAGEYAKNMNVSYSEALKVREEMAEIATASGDAALSANRLLQTHSAVSKALGTNAELNTADAQTMTKLVQQAGYQYDELMNIQKLSLANGKTLEDNTEAIFGGAKAYAARNGIVVNEKEVLKEVNNSSKALQLSLGGNTSAIAEAVVKAKQFGINLEQAESIAKGLLDFESSISAELEAELLTGKDLNFEKARQLSLEGNIAGAAAEVLKQVKSHAEFGAMNVIQQEAMAKAAGLNREQLAASLIEREALNKIGMKDAEEARKKYDLLRLTMTAEQAAAELGNDELAKQYEQQSNAEKFQQAVEKIKDIFTSMVDGPLGTMLNIFSTLLDYSFVLYGIVGLIAGVFTGKLVAGIGQAILKMGVLFTTSSATAVSATAAATAISFGAMIPIILGAVAAIGGAIYGFMQDGMIGPGGEMVVSGPKGSIQLDKDDSIIAGTNLMGNGKKKEDKTTQQPTQTTQASVDMTQTNALLQQLISAVTTGGTVMLDGQKVGEALKIGSFQTQ